MIPLGSQQIAVRWPLQHQYLKTIAHPTVRILTGQENKVFYIIFVGDTNRLASIFTPSKRVRSLKSCQLTVGQLDTLAFHLLSIMWIYAVSIGLTFLVPHAFPTTGTSHKVQQPGLLGLPLLCRCLGLQSCQLQIFVRLSSRKNSNVGVLPRGAEEHRLQLVPALVQLAAIAF